MLLNIRITELQMSKLKKISKKFDSNLTDYVKRKLFNENEDMVDDFVQYVSPEADKNNLLTVSVLYKTNFMVKEILAKQGYSQDEFVELEQRSLEFAREQREKHGYKILSNSDKE
jgi:hypothetical protein